MQIRVDECVSGATRVCAGVPGPSWASFDPVSDGGWAREVGMPSGSKWGSGWGILRCCPGSGLLVLDGSFRREEMVVMVASGRYSRTEGNAG